MNFTYFFVFLIAKGISHFLVSLWLFLKSDLTNNDKQPVNGETAASVRPAIHTRKRAEKQRKEREKLEKKERDRAAAIQVC